MPVQNPPLASGTALVQVSSPPTRLQFGLVRLLSVMLGAALVLGAGRWVSTTFTSEDLVTLVAVIAVSEPALLALVTMVAIACPNCPAGVYLHLFGILSVVIALPALLLSPLAILLLLAGGALLFFGPGLAVYESCTRELTFECHWLAWLSAANAMGVAVCLLLLICVLNTSHGM